MQSKGVIATARALLKDHGYFVDNLWHVKDIHFLCEQYKLPVLTNTQAMAVFDLANAQFDGEYGFSWPRLEKALREYVAQQEVEEMVG